MAELTGVEKVWPPCGWDYRKRLEQSLTVSSPRYRQGGPAQVTFKKLLVQPAELA